MKFSTTCVQAISLVGLASAAPYTRRQEADTLDFPPADKQFHAMSLEEAVALMEPPQNATDDPEFTITSIPEVTIQAGCRNSVHKRWGSMSPSERDGFVGAIKCLTTKKPKGVWKEARSIYDELAYVHHQLANDIHSMGSPVDNFLPWHRYYLHVFKTLLSEQCGYNGPMAWWHESNNHGNTAASDIFSPRWFGSLPAKGPNDVGFCIKDGAFAGLTEKLSQPGRETCVARGENKADTARVTIEMERLCQAGNGSTFQNHRACLEFNSHAAMHNGLGPTMSNPAVSVSDPIFWLHHGYIDYQWKKWQNNNPARWTTISGCANKQCDPLTRNTVLSSMGLMRDMTVGEVLDTEGQQLCYTYDELVR